MFQELIAAYAEEVWDTLGGEGLVTNAEWPLFDPSKVEDDSVILPIQVNGKRKDEIKVSKTASKEEIEKLALANATVLRILDGAEPKKLIVVPGRIINVVI